MISNDTVNVLLVDDQPAKLLAYEVILQELGENLIKTASARAAFECLLKNDVAVVLVDVCMPELDGFQLAAMICEHPRFQKTAIIFISAIHLTDVDRLRGYEMGAVDYIPVPVVPEVLRAKVKVFAELFRKTRQLEQLNRELERRVADRTAELKSSAARLLQCGQLRSLALAAGQMGSWTGMPPAAAFLGMKDSTAFSVPIRTVSRWSWTMFAPSFIRRIGSGCERRWRTSMNTRRPSRPSFASIARMESCAGALVLLRRASMRLIASFVSVA